MRAISISVLVTSIGFSISCRSNLNPTANAAGAQAAPASTPTVEVTKVVSRKLGLTVRLPGELQPYEAVAIFPKITSFVDWIGVDRGSVVKSGQLMVRLVAPEIAAQRREAESRLQAAVAQRAESEAKLASDPQFAADPRARLRWWFDQSKYQGGDAGRYPVVRVWQKTW